MKAPSREESNVLREIAGVTGRRHTDSHQFIERFNDCPDWQAASTLLTKALGGHVNHSRERSERSIAAPPAWLPPML